ncbi:uncharacterized protein [Euwallacea similis]|uniref:uncharacterized protein n=1 Tax=Euwallacea similis TaxID=1736056 RepID=UPI00344BDF7D
MVSKIFVSSPVCIFALYFTLLSNDVSAQNITCYKCSSSPNNTDCSDPLGINVATISCDGSLNYCTKVTYKTQNVMVTSRGCDAITSDTCASINATLASNYTGLSDFSCLTCSTDLCNSSIVFGVPLITIVATLLFVRFL